MGKTFEGNGSIPFRLRVGITGTRTLTETAVIEESLRTILTTRYKQAFNADGQRALSGLHATPLAFTLVSPLAEGADRLAARVALELPGTRLEVILPLKPEDYREDFAANDSCEDFSELLALAQRVTVVPPFPRPECYWQVGKAVVDSCDILVAVWDGQPSRGRGGTAEIVAMATEQGKPVFIISTIAPHAITLRNGERLTGSHLAGLEEFNAYPLDSSTFRQSAANQGRWLFTASAAESIPQTTRSVIETHLIPPFVRAEAVAAHCQDRYLRSGLFGYLIALFSVAILAMAIVLFHNNLTMSAVFYGIELTALAAVFIMIHRAHKAGVHEKWLANRALAERLRNAFYFVACGLPPTHPRLDAEENPLFTGDHDWTAVAFAEVCAGLSLVPRPEDLNCPALAQYIKTSWVDDQRAYHHSNVVGKPGAKAWIKRFGTQRCDDLLRRLALGSFLGAMIISALHLVFALFNLHGGWVKPVEVVLTIIAILLPVAGATFNGYRSLMEFSQMTASSEMMQIQLGRIAPHLQEVRNADELEKCLRRIEDLMLLESQDWVRLMSFSDLERVA
jgi:hypothetical protein